MARTWLIPAVTAMLLFLSGCTRPSTDPGGDDSAADSPSDLSSALEVKNGYIACGSGAGTGDGALTQVECGAADPEQAFLFNYTIGDHLAGILLEMVWTPVGNNSRDLVLIAEKDQCDFYCELPDTFAQNQGCCYIRIELPVDSLTKPEARQPATDFRTDGGRIQTRTFPAFAEGIGPPTVYLGQDFVIYAELFYETLPADFSSRTNVPSG